MAVYPVTEDGVIDLAQKVIDGVTAYPTVFPSVSVAELTAALTAYI